MKTYILGLGLCLCMTSCLNDGFLDIDPKDRQTEQTAFHTIILRCIHGDYMKSFMDMEIIKI